MSLFIIDCDTYLQAKSVNYNVEIDGMFAVCKLFQNYVIGSNISEAMYKFPVDYNSAFCNLTIKTPREKIQAIVKEKNAAKQIYEMAKQQGYQSFYTEESESDRDIYQLSMVNLLSGDLITIKYTYITEITVKNNSSVFYIPSFISPRYGGQFITNSEHSIQIKVVIVSEDIKCIKSSMPNTEIIFDDNKTILKAESNKYFDSDMEIIYDFKFLDRCIKFNSNTYQMAIAQFIPEQKTQDTIRDQSLVFVLDCSGSMLGIRIESAKKAIIHCLKQLLESNEKTNICSCFNIIRFGST